MDRLDKIALATILVLLMSTAVLMLNMSNEPKLEQGPGPASVPVRTPDSAADMERAVQPIKNLLEADSLSQAELLIRELIKNHPHQGEPHMLMGDLLMRKQEPVNAMHEYKQAIDLNPDYLDKKTPLFQGKKLKVAVGEALAEIDSQIKSNPGNSALKSEKKMVYYLYRKIAGGCG
jgi:cytochrome c-type biogenesis protein CcmH/NrfG